MPSNLVEVDTWTGTVTVPADGDTANAASVNGAFQALANRATHLRSRVPGAASSYLVRVPLAAGLFGADWSFSGSGILVQSTVGAGGSLAITWGPQLPQTGTITAIRARLDGQSHVTLPGNMPTLTLRHVDTSGGGTIVLSVTDPSASVAAYDVPHTIEAVGSHALAVGSYQLQFVGENAGGALNNGLRVFWVEIQVTP